MPFGLVITVATQNQEDRIVAALTSGQQLPEGVTPKQFAQQLVKRWAITQAIAHEQQVAQNAAYDAARVQAETDFEGA